MLNQCQPLPYDQASFPSAEAYISSLLDFTSTSSIFQILCGGVHILDFFTLPRESQSLFHAALPQEWHAFLLSCDVMRLLRFLLHDDLDTPGALADLQVDPPQSLVDYVKNVRKYSLRRDFCEGRAVGEAKATGAKGQGVPKLPRGVSVGMKPKKIHEVSNFAHYVEDLSEKMEKEKGTQISHFVDFGSGQNYLGRALASEPYNKHVVAVEGRENNVQAAKGLDVISGFATKQVVMRNKKLYNKLREQVTRPDGTRDEVALAKAFEEATGGTDYDFRSSRELTAQYSPDEGKGTVQYVSGRLDSGELSEIISKIDRKNKDANAHEEESLNLMAVSIHSCGNLSHFGIRSLILNPDIRAVAIVGCCYNLMTERLGPPTYKHPYLRPTLQAVNGRVMRESSKRDPQGFPMSNKFATYKDEGVRLNITARMMACQAPSNWNREESEGFFTRHFYRAVLQKIFLDRGVVEKINHRNPEETDDLENASPFDVSTSPVTIGSLRKSCYASVHAYVRGVIEKLSSSTEFKQYAEVMREKMGGITDEEIEEYVRTYEPRKKEICIMWTLMAFSAVVVESLIVSDRWTFLQEQDDVEEAWVETVFDFAQSPRNLVVVGIKK